MHMCMHECVHIIWKDGRTEGRKDGRTEGRKDGRTDGRTDGSKKARKQGREREGGGVGVEEVGVISVVFTPPPQIPDPTPRQITFITD
jgi:hypothetical protein